MNFIQSKSDILIKKFFENSNRKIQDAKELHILKKLLGLFLVKH